MDSGSAWSHSTHLETSSSDRPIMVTYTDPVHAMDVMYAKYHARNTRTAVPK